RGRSEAVLQLGHSSMANIATVARNSAARPPMALRDRVAVALHPLEQPTCHQLSYAKARGDQRPMATRARHYKAGEGVAGGSQYILRGEFPRAEVAPQRRRKRHAAVTSRRSRD